VKRRQFLTRVNVMRAEIAHEAISFSRALAISASF
jgi:hypothetical protein